MLQRTIFLTIKINYLIEKKKQLHKPLNQYFQAKTYQDQLKSINFSLIIIDYYI